MKISLLVPFRANGPRDTRVKAWKWLEQRWQTILPEAELCMGTDTGEPFSKSVAVNDAYSKSTGDMLVIADADSWVERPQIETGLEHAASYEHLVVPWWTAYRLTREDSQTLMKMPPDSILPVTREMKERAAGTGPSPASAAMVIILQRKAFERVGGWDPRFRGWGSEDVSFGNACWTFLGRNRYTLGEAFALYHPAPTNDEGMRVWKNDPGSLNTKLYERYRKATGHPMLMEILCSEHALPGASVRVGPAPTLNFDDLVELPEMDVNNPPNDDAVRVREAVGPYEGDERITI